MSEYESSDLLDMTAEIVSSYVSNNQVEADALRRRRRLLHAPLLKLTRRTQNVHSLWVDL